MKQLCYHIQKRTNLPIRGVENTVQLLEEGATVPFISRYRKERTGSLDEVAVGAVKTELENLKTFIKRKEYILGVIEEQDLLTDPLKNKITNCWEETILEDIYLPFKKKKKTKATAARDKGLEPLARLLFEQRSDDAQHEAGKYITSLVVNEGEALLGARHIIAEWINENAKARSIVRDVFKKSATLNASVVKKQKEVAGKYRDYFKYSESIKKCPSHRVLAVFRGDDEGMLKLSFEFDNERAFDRLVGLFVVAQNESSDQVWLAVEDSLKRLIIPSIENEVRKEVKERADQEAIDVFAKNLQQLLLAAPLGQQPILAIDPGFRTGCKVVCLSENGDFLHSTTIYPHPPLGEVEATIASLTSLVFEHQVGAIAIGDGTAGRETHELIKNIKFDHPVEVFMVNESGASIYSASEIARNEFPDLDLTVRGAISIGRRLMDPLAELVKVDAKSIGVGQYQHDVNQTMLKSSLDQVVENSVNTVGINLNTASEHLLTYVSGLGPTLASNIVAYRTENGNFTQRKDLLKVPRMGKKAFEQAAGFLRVKEGKQILDATGVHPERYALVKQIAKDLGLKLEDIVDDNQLKTKVNLNRYISDDVGLPTLRDILKELSKPGLDPRGRARVFEFTEGIKSIADVKPGMIVKGQVNNLTKFGAFINLGIKESGLVHVSQIVDKYIKDPAQVLKLGQEVEAKVMDVDLSRGRISLSMKEV